MTQPLGARGGAAPARLILAFIAAVSAARLLACLWLGFGDDEAYTLVIARQLSLSYFDHPPLHQWILHGFVSVFGEGHGDRLPFWAMQVATNLPLYALTKRLFGRDAGLWAIFAFNATAYSLTAPDGVIMPDAPLLLALATAIWAVAEILFASDLGQTRTTWLWLVAGLAFGLAGLAKYSAVLAPLGLLGFFLGSARGRRWLTDPRSYLAAAIAIALFTPVLIWNARHGWASLHFQSSRALGAPTVSLAAVSASLAALGAQVVSLSPWAAAPIVAGLYGALRSRDRESGQRLLLWLALPPVLLFAALPLVGQRAIPHWFNSGWLFAYPLAGAWVSDLAMAQARLWARVSAVCAVVTLALYAPIVELGPARFAPKLAADFADPTARMFDWASMATTHSWTAGGRPPDFVLVENWRVGGRVGAALGPGVPICGFGPGPRGFAFTCDAEAVVGHDALIVTTGADAASVFSDAIGNFERLGSPEIFSVGRFGAAEIHLAAARAYSLKGAFPAPYGDDETLSRR